MSREVASTKGCRSSQFPDLPAEGGPPLGGSRSSTGFVARPHGVSLRAASRAINDPPKSFMGTGSLISKGTLSSEMRAACRPGASPRPTLKMSSSSSNTGLEQPDWGASCKCVDRRER